MVYIKKPFPILTTTQRCPIGPDLLSNKTKCCNCTTYTVDVWGNGKRKRNAWTHVIEYIPCNLRRLPELDATMYLPPAQGGRSEMCRKKLQISD